MPRALPSEPKPAKGPRTRKCSAKGCMHRVVPDPLEPRVTWCSEDCAVTIALDAMAARKAKLERATRAAKKVERAEDRKRKIALQPRKWYVATLKTAMHAYVRARDEGKQCASCDTVLIRLGRIGGDYDAGHFRSVGSAAHLRFDERNIWGQCKHCNDAKTGNPHEYERRLRLRKGDQFVDELLADQAPRKYTITDLEAMTAHYRAKLKQLKEAA